MILFWRYVMYWLPSFLVILSCGWILYDEHRKNTRENLRSVAQQTASITPQVSVPMPEIAARGRQTVWVKTLLLLMIVGLSLAAGYGRRDYELTISTITYSNVYIQQKINDKRFLVRPQWMNTLDSELCPSSVVDWREGETLRDWTFEQRRGCKRVISYHKYTKGEVNASIR